MEFVAVAAFCSNIYNEIQQRNTIYMTWYTMVQATMRLPSSWVLRTIFYVLSAFVFLLLHWLRVHIVFRSSFDKLTICSMFMCTMNMALHTVNSSCSFSVYRAHCFIKYIEVHTIMYGYALVSADFFLHRFVSCFYFFCVDNLRLIAASGITASQQSAYSMRIPLWSCTIPDKHARLAVLSYFLPTFMSMWI